MQPPRAEQILRAWAELAGVPSLTACQVIVRPRSMLGREGWVGLVVGGGTLTAAVPREDLVPRVETALSAISLRAPSPAEIEARLRPLAVLGPASLFYPPGPLDPPAISPDVSRIAPVEWEPFRLALPESDLDESGLRELEADAFGVRDHDSKLIAACGYLRWPGQIAHLCVATLPGNRRRGAARRAAEAAISDATANGLLPQWRARPEESKALARALGLEEWGFQMSLRI